MSALTLLPAPAFSETAEGFYVLRDDLLYGGTKRRALERCLEPGREYVFATPAEGHAQLALALAARSRGADATLFVAKRAHLASRTALAQEQGAKVVQVPHGRLSNVQAKARAYAEAQGAELFELGLRSPASELALAEVCAEAEARLCQLLGQDRFRGQVFFAIGSGTLSRCIFRAFSGPCHGVIVGHEPKPGAVPGSVFQHRAPEAFAQEAELPPPFPSSPNYDAKVWRFAVERGKPGDLIWNVA